MPAYQDNPVCAEHPAILDSPEFRARKEKPDPLDMDNPDTLEKRDWLVFLAKPGDPEPPVPPDKMGSPASLD